ncbi:hypothetical protein G7058_01430 [Jeotgalibaca porci]|uniref:Uncharacterized protein n=1 Tax=Jeotgalibaca porci TaxID=1868793 RepID=A0A6G7WEV3_9LACT|nr:hypothetical protein [Jeotgalibaca porci]QIK50824.1 hypothetical protein G7058_01430 [Jeotgalibaca porci]
MHYESEETVTENLTLARHDLSNFIAKNADKLSDSDLQFLQNHVLNRLNIVHQNWIILQDKR